MNIAKKCVFVGAAAAALMASLASAQTPTEESTPVTSTPAASVTSAGTATPAETPTPVQPTESVPAPSLDTNGLPFRPISNDASLPVRLTASDGADVETLIELQPGGHFDGEQIVLPDEPLPLVSVFSVAGRADFRSIPNGEYLLWVWWGPGFEDVNAYPSNTGLFLSQVRVNDGQVIGSLPAELRLSPKPEGVLGYPVRSGDAGRAIPRGVVDVLQVLRGAPPVVLPETGAATSSGDDDAATAWWWLGALGLTAALALGLTLPQFRRRL